MTLTQQVLAKFPADEQADALEQARQIIAEQVANAKTPRQRERWVASDPAVLALKMLSARRLRAALAKAHADGTLKPVQAVKPKRQPLTLEEAKRRAQDYISRNPLTKEMLEAWADADEKAACPKCGRVIYCGADRLCRENECPHKTSK